MKETQAHLSGLAANRAELLQAQLQILRQRVSMSADRAEFKKFLVPAVAGTPNPDDRLNAEKRITRVLPDKKTIVSAALADKAGNVLFASDPAMQGRNLANQWDFIHGLQEPYIGAPRRRGTGFIAMLVAPVMNKEEAAGALILDANLSKFTTVVQDTSGLGETGEVLLVGHDATSWRALLPGRNDSDQAQFANAADIEALTKSATHFARMRDYRNEPVLAVGHPIGYSNWWLIAKMNEKEAYGPADESLHWRLAYGGLVALAGLAAAYALVHNFTRPIRRLAHASALVAQGDYEAVVPLGLSDEMGVLSRSFNDMLAAIRTRQAERDQAGRALLEVNRRKDEFLAMLGHELRNPLSAIASATQLWKEAGADPTTAGQMREVIERQAGNLKRLVDDLLDVARIATGKIELHPRPVVLGELISHAVEAMRPSVEARRHALEVTLAQPPVLVRADPTRVEQIIGNLLANATKYTPDGGRISVVERREEDEVVVTVSDNGIGIDPEVLHGIFELFAQAHPTFDRSSGGLGIGLNLCRQLAELHGGSVSACSDGPGRGARFTLRLPLMHDAELAVRDAQPAETLALPVPSHRILVVDDNEETALLLARLLTRRGHEVRCAFDGLAALEAAQEFKPEIFLLDIGLPGLDGYALARRLKSEGFAEALLIAISGFAQDLDRERGREAGFAHYFSKPVDFAALMTLLAAGKAQA
jgi:signal transduction histidine kinase/ActR/RegA family two-component response regulator